MLDQLKAYIDAQVLEMNNDTLLKKIEKVLDFQQIKKKKRDKLIKSINKYTLSYVETGELSNKIYNKIKTQIVNLKCKKKVKPTVITVLNKYTNYYKEPNVYLLALEMDIRSTKYIYELDPVENYSSLIKKLNNKEFIFNTIFDKDTIDYHDLDGAMALFLLSFDLSTIYRPVKSLKELCAIKLAKSMNKIDMLERLIAKQRRNTRP